ncbi:MAG: DUF5683 domain-containing protein [Fodinibius sp.]|nr:DUF5683 domain-containing protein [Fodinibius sp.]
MGSAVEGYSQFRSYSNRVQLQPQAVQWNQSFSLQDTTRSDPSPNLPDPNSVMYKSMMLPGWGQVINKQAWKVPIVYAILGGLGYYSVYLTKQYHDYRAAYYNLNPRPPENELPTDQRFGPTPSYISENANLEQLKTLRNTYHNRRDLVYVGLALAYGLNIVDAYVFAHLRSFDVSEDLSMRPRISPAIMAQSGPGVTLSIDLIRK